MNQSDASRWTTSFHWDEHNVACQPHQYQDHLTTCHNSWAFRQTKKIILLTLLFSHLQQPLCLVCASRNHTKRVTELDMVGNQTSANHFTIIEIERKLNWIGLYITETPTVLCTLKCLICALSPVEDFSKTSLEFHLTLWQLRPPSASHFCVCTSKTKTHTGLIEDTEATPSST